MKRHIIAVGAAFAIVAASPTNAQVLTFATNAQGSLAYRAGIAIAKLLESKTDLKARAQPMGGSTTYIPMIARGEANFGFTNAQELLYAYNGTGTFEGKPNKDLRYVTMVFPLRAGIAVVKDSGIKSVTDLRQHKGLRVTSGYTDLTIIETYLKSGLTAAGLSYENDFKHVPVSGFVKGMLAIGEDKTDITWISLGSGAGRKAMAQLKSRGGWRYINFDTSPEAKAKFKKMVPAGEIVLEKRTKMPGIVEPTYIMQLRYMLVTSSKADPDTVYKIVKTIAANKATLAKSFPAFRGLRVEDMGVQGGMPYHPGALKAYKELGFTVGAEMIPGS